MPSLCMHRHEIGTKHHRLKPLPNNNLFDNTTIVSFFLLIMILSQSCHTHIANKLRNQSATIMDKIFETNFSFLCEIAHQGKSSIFVFRSFLLVLTKFLFGSKARHQDVFCDILIVPDISQFCKILGNQLGNLYIPCLLLIITLRFTCDEKKIW